jgi:hypothetical protein
MRKTAKVLGIIATCMIFIGVSMKLVHFPGGSILVIFGVGIFTGFFIPLLSILKNKNATSGMDRAAAILGWIGGSGLAIELLFTVQHWPGGGQLIFLSGPASIAFLILHFISISKYENGRKKFGIFDVMIVIVFVMLFLARNGAIESSIETQKKIAGYENAIAQEKQLEQFNHDLYLKIVADTTDTTTVEAAKKLENTTSDILVYINSIKNELIQHEMYMPLGNSFVVDTLSPRLIPRPTDYDGPTHYMIGADPANITGEAKQLKKTLMNYYDNLVKSIPENLQHDFSSKIDTLIPTERKFTDQKDQLLFWEGYYFYHKTIIECLTNLVKLETDILSAEKTAFEQIKK